MNYTRLMGAIPAAGLMLGGLALPSILQAQEPQEPSFRVQVTEYVERATDAVNYRHRSGATSIGFEGTPLLPEANGEAKVESKQGYIEVEVEFDDLEPASKFGPEFLTYVLWAITPEGRANNLGEVILNGNRSKLNVTTDLQAFGLVVTAEPYFAVSIPSDVVVLENVIRDDTKGRIETIRANYELLKRGSYGNNAAAGALKYRDDNDAPLELPQADNAIRIARAAGAERYANEPLTRAIQAMARAETYYGDDNDKNARQHAREAVQIAEDARLIAVQKTEEARLAEERRIAEQKTAEANRLAAQEAANRREAELKAQLAASERVRAEEQARNAARDAEAASRRAQDAAREAERNAAAKAEAEAARLAAEQAHQQAEAARLAAAQEADRLARERAAADAARAEAQQQALTAQQDAQQARELAAKAEQERAELRDRLQRQLNSVLDTKQTARGLIVNMSDVLFDVDRSTLKPGAREKLAKVAGILLAHPDLTLKAEGHTDSTGGDEYNQRLSEARAEAVRSFLVSQGIQPTAITAQGFGETQPVTTNETAVGRQQNRRVELVISGESIESSQNRPAPSTNASAR